MTKLAGNTIIFLLTLKDIILNSITFGWWNEYEGNKRIADEFRK